MAETVGIFDLRKRSLPGRVWPTDMDGRKEEGRRRREGGEEKEKEKEEGRRRWEGGEEKQLWNQQAWRERVKARDH